MNFEKLKQQLREIIIQETTGEFCRYCQFTNDCELSHSCFWEANFDKRIDHVLDVIDGFEYEEDDE